LSEQEIGLFILVFSYTVAFALGAFFTNYFFKKSIKDFGEFSLFKNSNLKEKVFTSFISIVLTKLFF
jgi:hypothetical protein